MKKAFKYIFMIYVILLAGYASYKNLMNLKLGKQTVARTAPLGQCEDMGDWNYCVYDGPNTDENVLLYFLHGKDESHDSWAKDTGFPALLESYWEEKKYRRPRVVTVSFGKTWIVTPKMSKPETGLMERFETEIFVRIERKLGRPQRRFLMGASMGGLNALTLAFSFPQYFSRVASLCPPVYTISPYSTLADMARFLHRTGAKPKSLLTSIGVGLHFFANEEEWNQFSPIERAKNVILSDSISFYITSGLRDEFGIFEGGLRLAKTLQSRGVRTFWRPTSGDHCAVDVTSLGDFLRL